MFQQPIQSQMTLKTQRVILRPLEPEDHLSISHYAGNRILAEGTCNVPHPLPADFAQTLIDRALVAGRDEDIWAIDGSPIGLDSLVGLISLHRLGRDQSDITYWIGEPFWGSGLASEALEALLSANPQYCRTVFASVFQDNPASARVLTNCGFQYIGDAESYSIARGKTVATWTYSLKCS